MQCTALFIHIVYSNRMPSKMLDEITFSFSKVNRCTVEDGGMDWLFRTRLYSGCSYPFILGFKLIHVSKWCFKCMVNWGPHFLCLLGQFIPHIPTSLSYVETILSNCVRLYSIDASAANLLNDGATCNCHCHTVLGINRIKLKWQRSKYWIWNAISVTSLSIIGSSTKFILYVCTRSSRWECRRSRL